MSIYRSYKIQTDYVEIKFVDSIQTATLINSSFVVYDATTATPTVITDPFQTIDLLRDYSSISRTILLWWNPNILSDNKDYQISINGLKTIIGSVIDSETISFSTGLISEDLAADLDEPPTRLPVEVEDYSVKEVSFATTITGTTTSTFKVVSIVPDLNNSFYLDSSFNEGRIEIYFSDIPAANFISSDYFKVQKKLINRGISTWVNVSALVTSNPENKLVVIYLPSTDATPLYGEPDVVYWEEGYKYRLRIASNIGI